MRYLENLNTSQHAAVTAPLGPVSVLAGPGSGKTRVLTNRIQHLFYNNHFAPNRIRAVTFTQNGTQTMRERLNADGVRDVHISTFHSLCRSIIDRHYHRNTDLVDLCKTAGVAMPFCWHSFQRKENRPLLDWYKNDGRLTPEDAHFIAFQYACVAFSQRIPPKIDFTPEGYRRIEQAFWSIRRELRPVHGYIDVGMPELTLLGNYEGLCRFRDYVMKAFGYELQVADTLHPDYLYMVSQFSRGSPLLQTYFIDAYHQLVEHYAFIDFTSQILWAHRILLSSPEALQSMQKQYDALLIDEFQDTDPVQFDIAQRIVAAHKNIFVVGDHNQAIYGFRGADAQNLKRFRETFPDAHEVLLDINYRSTPEIVEVSRAVVEKYQDPNYIFPSANKSNGAVVKAVDRLTDVQISEPAELLVLSYTNRAVQENGYALKAVGIPFVKTIRFAEDGERRVFCVRKPIVERVLDVMAFLYDPTPENTLKAASHLNGIGSKTVEKLANVDDLTSEPRLEPLYDFYEQFAPLTLGSQVQNIGDASGRSPEGEYGIFTGSSLNWHSGSVSSDVAFLGRVLTDYDRIPTYEELVENSAQMMTVHQAKGMEAPVVIVDGYSFFAARGSDLETSTYEMARVMYVALSRAESELYLVTDRRDFPNMEDVYETIEKQAETSRAIDEDYDEPSN